MELSTKIVYATCWTQINFNMRKFFILTIITLFIFSCSKEENSIIPEIETPQEQDIWLDFLGTYSGYSQRVITTESADCDTLVFSGLKNEKLWFAKYQKSTKVKLYEWQDSAPFDTIISIDKGYGQTDVKQSFMVIPLMFIQSNDAQVVAFQTVYDDLNIGNNIYRNETPIFYGRYKADNNFYYEESQFNNVGFPEIATVMVFKNSKSRSIIIKNSYNEYNPNIFNGFDRTIFFRSDCYDYYGNLLYKSVIKSSGPTPNVAAYLYENRNVVNFINNKEVILFYHSNTGCELFIREDLETQETIWQSEAVKYYDYTSYLPNKSLTLIEKNNSLWTFQLEFLYYSGEKEQKTIKIDINTGEFEMN